MKSASRARPLVKPISSLLVLLIVGCGSNEPEWSHPAHSSPIKCIAWSADGTRLASADDGGGVIVWDPSTGRIMKKIFLNQSDPIRTIETIGFIPDGKHLAVGFKGIRLVDLETGQAIRSLETPAPVRAMAISSAGPRIVSGGDDGLVRVWNPEKSSEPQSLKAHRGEVTSVAIDAPGKRLASGGQDQSVVFWRLGEEQPLRTVSAGAAVGALAFMKEGSILGGWIRDGSVRLWDPETGKERSRIPVGPSSAVAFAGDGTVAACASAGVGVRIVDLATGTAEATFLPGERAEALAISPDSKILAVGSSTGGISIWKLKK